MKGELKVGEFVGAFTNPELALVLKQNLMKGELKAHKVKKLMTFEKLTNLMKGELKAEVLPTSIEISNTESHEGRIESLSTLSLALLTKL